MKEELKTLKDINKHGNYIMKHHLRQEAIKHYNEVKKWADTDLTDWIKRFFNLTEEELSGAGK